MDTVTIRPEGLREQKRRQTLERIAQTGLKLFVENGFEATTLDAIAAASGISRRTFFYYFKSKEDVLLAHEGGGFAEALRPELLAQSPDQSPIAAARQCFLSLASRYEAPQSIIADRLLRSTEALRLRKEALYSDIERVLAQAMQERWPDPARRDALRMAAMIAMGTARLALDNWRQDDAREPLAHYMQASFALLDSQF